MNKNMKALCVAIGTVLFIVGLTQYSHYQQRREKPPATAAVVEPAGRTWPKVEIYTTSWCPACRVAIGYLQEKKVPFTLYDIEKDPEAEARFRGMSLRGAVPFAVIGEEKILGFDPQVYGKALGL